MYWYDGKLVDSTQIQLNIDHSGLLYGASVFSTMRVYENSLAHYLSYWSAHCDRLRHSLQVFGWQQPDWKRLKQGAQIMLAHFPVLRMVIFPDGTEWITGRDLPANLNQRQVNGICAWVARDSIYRRELAEHKTGNYLGAYLARSQALSLGAQEAILVDSQGNWLETSTGNLWGWRDNCWYTPHLDSAILPGIGRSHLLKYLQGRGLLVKQNLWTPQFVKTLSGLLYSNCVVERVPIITVLAPEPCVSRIDYPLINLP